jgi:hypothetical protein
MVATGSVLRVADWKEECLVNSTQKSTFFTDSGIQYGLINPGRERAMLMVINGL